MTGHPARRGHDALSADLYKVGNFTIGRVLGVGSFGKVKLATLDRRRGGGEYAVKIMEKDKVQVTSLSTQIRNEVQVMQALGTHANIVQLHSVETTSDKVYIFMELILGGELFDEIVRNTRLPELRSRYYFTQLIAGLAACHDRGIYHRDLKPENLLIDANGVLKISDFGLSSVKKKHPSTSTSLAAASFRQRELERGAGGPARTPMTSLGHSTGRTLLHTQCGTPNYVAPEIISLGEEQGYSGAKVDIWSCGVILYVLVAGALPFDSEDTEMLFRMILSGKTQYPKHFSQPLIDLCSNLLQTDPKIRFSLKEVSESPWMTMPAEELAKLCNEDVSLVPKYPDGYVVSFPWEEGGDGSIPSPRLDNVPINLDIGVGTSDLFASPVVDLDPTPKVPSAASFGVGGGYGEGVGVYDALSNEALSLEPMLPPAVGNGVTQGGHGDVHDFVSVSFQEDMVSPNLEGAGNLARTVGSGGGSPQPTSQQSSIVYSSSSPPGGTDGASPNVLGDQLRHQPATYTPQSHSQDSSMGAMAQIQNEISAMKSASIYDRNSESDGASAQGRVSSVVAAAAAAAAAVLPQGSRDQIAVVAAAAASAAANAVARSSAGSFQARSGSSLEDTNEMWRRKVEIDASGATRPVYLVDSAENDGKSHQAILNANRAAMDMAKAANDFASANLVAERAMFRAAAAANAAVSVFGGRVAEHPQQGQVQAYSHAQQQDQPRLQVTAPSQHVQFQVESSQFRPASSVAGQNPHLTRRLSRSGASFRSSPKPVMVDGSLVGAGTTYNSGSPVLSPIGQSPLTSMASNGVDAVAGRRVPAVSSAGKTGTTRTAPASTSAGLPVHSQARSQASDQRHYHEMVTKHRHLVKQLQEVQHDQLGQLKQLHARQLQRVNQAMQSEVGPQPAGGVSARLNSSRDTKGADGGAHSPNPLASKERQKAIMASPSGASQSGLPGTGGEDRVSVGGDTRKNAGERSPNPKSGGATASLASPGPSTGAEEKSAPSPATPPPTYVPSAIVRDGDSGKQENMFDMNIPRPAFGPSPPPKQSKLAVAIQASTGFGKKKQRRPGSGATRSVSQHDGSKSCGVSVAKIAGSILPGASTAQYTQFHSLNPPRKCCELVEGSLKSYGCSQVSGKASGPESYKIKCVKVVERQPIVVSIDIYQADGDLSAISFKRKGNVDARRFCQLFDDVHRLFSQKCAQLEPAEEDESGAVLSSLEEDGVGSSPITRTGRSNE